MQLSVNQILGSFRVVSLRESAELKARVVEFLHEKTGCRLLWLDNGNENKVFSIAFRTLPEDDTGVFHILEHSVLCGSAKYPVREPFVELLKGSMNTFLNAMTFPDMTMYPVSSRNDRDILNLTEVYLDAVFAPRILRDERIFRQEGWHIEPDGEGKYIYKGVVFNEMKGSMSDPDSLGERRVLHQLFPDNAYGFNSGGEPECIPDLTYDRFLDQYRRHYHPSNARIYLDGAVPLEEMLSLIASYLDPMEALENLPDTPLQTPVSSDETISFELGQEEEMEDRGQLYLSRILGSWKDKTMNMAVSLIGEVLTGTNDSPLKRLVLEKELAQDIDLMMDDTCCQSFLIIHAENVSDGREEELLSLIESYGDVIEKTGLDRNALEASLNRMAYNLKEEEEPQGIGRAMHASGIWLYGGDPLLALENDAEVAELRRMLASGELDRLAVDLFRNREGLCVLRMRPSRTLGDEKRRAEEARLSRITSAWTEADKKANEALLSSLNDWQTTPDSPEALSTLPMLKKEDADLPPVWVETEESDQDGARFLLHRLPTGGIVHMRICFSLSDFSARDLLRVNMFTSLLGKLPTARHDALSLQQDLKRYTGRFGSSVFVGSRSGDHTVCAPMLIVSASVLKEYLPQAQALLTEILLTSDFTAADKIMELILQMEISARQRPVTAGHFVAIRSVLSHYSAEYSLKNTLEGDEALRYVHAFAKEPEEHLKDLSEAAQRLVSASLCRSRAVFSMTAEEPFSWQPVLEALPLGTPIDPYASYTTDTPLRRGYRIPAQVGFAVRGYHLSCCGRAFDGSMWLAANILSLSYLWNVIRVQGGAYGAGFHFDRNGSMYSYSYRDPTPDRTLRASSGLSGFLKEFARGHESLDKYIISTLNDLNPLLSPRDKGALADSRYLNGYTREDVERVRRQILTATMDDLLKCADILDEFAEKGAVCVVAPETSLEKVNDIVIEDL